MNAIVYGSYAYTQWINVLVFVMKVLMGKCTVAIVVEEMRQ